jgi:hypothetical protein
LLRVIDFSDSATILFPQSQILPQSECYRSAPTVEPSAPRNARETMEEALLIVAVIEGVALAGVKVREHCRFKNRLKDILREQPTGVFASPGANQNLSAFSIASSVPMASPVATLHSQKADSFPRYYVRSSEVTILGAFWPTPCREKISPTRSVRS